MKNENKIRLDNVRLSYPSLAKPSSFEENEPKYRASFLLNKEEHKAKIKELVNLVKELKSSKNVKSEKIYVLYNGDDEDKYGKNKDDNGNWAEKGHYVVSATNKKRPACVSRKKKEIPEEEIEETLYPGCRVNVMLQLYVAKKYNSLCGSLLGIQFSADDDAFGVSPRTSINDFDDLGDDPNSDNSDFDDVDVDTDLPF